MIRIAGPVLLSALLLSSTSAFASEGADARADWPQWRGAKRDAVSTETGLLADWPDDGPRVVWRRDGGAGYSGVAVAGGRLYTMWDEKNGQYLVSLDALSGKEHWRARLGDAFKNHYGDGPRSTPLVDDGLVYAVGTQGKLVALNAKNGETVWQHDLAKELKAELPSYGYSSSPLLVDDRILLEAGGKDATFLAFHKKTGRLAWASQTDQPAYSSPIEVTIDGVPQVVFWSAHGLHAVSPADGSLLWKYGWETFCPVSGDPLNTGTPIFLAPDRVFLSSGSGAAVVRVSRSGATFEIETVWKSESLRSDVSTPVLIGDYVYGFDRGMLVCVDARTGELQWKARGFQRGSLIAADGKLIVLGETGNLALVDPDPKAFVKRENVQILQGRNWTLPSLANGKLYLRNHDEIVCLDLKG